ncbi:MAG: glycosyltransferase family 4 protein [Methanosarcinales archaeon]|nr:glycosyltransferase family 4 protein [Methanosarcinales archaeon]
MKIGEIAHVYPPHIGGLENYVCRLKQSIEHKSNDVTVYTTDMGISNNMNRKEGNVIYCKTNFSLLRNPFSFELMKKLKQSNENIYHLHGYEFIPSLFATKILKNKPKVLTQHGAEIECNNLKIHLLNKAYHPFAQYILENMDMIIALGKKDRDFLLKSFDLSPDKITIIPNGIDIDKFKSTDENNNDFIKKNNLNRDCFKILFVSRLIETKNAHRLINAVTKHIKNKDIEVIVIGFGDAEYISQLKAISDNRIHILGEVRFVDLIAAYNVSNLFILLGEWGEGMPTVILEAMACGLPILTTTGGSISDVITEGENGFFIDVSIDEKKLAEKIEYIMDSDNGKMAGANMVKVNMEFNWEVIADRIYDVYKRVLEK